MKLKKAANCTDIHWGRKNNSEIHNQDCSEFIDWFVEQVRSDSSIDHINFLGDWFDNRITINGQTLSTSYQAAKQLNDLNLPIFFTSGNHDQYYRNNRNINNTNIFSSLQNFKVINEITVERDVGSDGCVYSPYLFHHEYPELLKYTHIPVHMGHFEFKGFVVTGETVVMQHGPDPQDFKQIKRLLSGHFHKRQSQKNIHYIGNTFPMDFSDEGDFNRGMATYEYDSDTLNYINWPDMPSYMKVTSSELTKNYKTLLKPKMTVRCVIDSEMTYEDMMEMKEVLTKRYSLRQLQWIEPMNMNKESSDEANVDIEDMSTEPLESVIKNILENLKVDSIDNKELIKIYNEL